MRTEHLSFSSGRWWGALDGPAPLRGAQLVLVFGEREALAGADFLAPLRDRYPDARIVSCSSGGNVLDDRVTTEGAVATAVEFASTTGRAPDAAPDARDTGGGSPAPVTAAGGRHFSDTT